MFEITIKGKVYKFKFGMGFLREINKTVGLPVQGIDTIKKNIGFQYNLSGLIDGDVESLVEILLAANKGYEPRATKDILDDYIDDENTDIDKLFDDILGFLKKANATKKTVKALLEELEKEKAKAEAQAKAQAKA